MSPTPPESPEPQESRDSRAPEALAERRGPPCDLILDGSPRRPSLEALGAALPDVRRESAESLELRIAEHLGLSPGSVLILSDAADAFTRVAAGLAGMPVEVLGHPAADAAPLTGLARAATAEETSEPGDALVFYADPPAFVSADERSGVLAVVDARGDELEPDGPIPHGLRTRSEDWLALFELGPGLGLRGLGLCCLVGTATRIRSLTRAPRRLSPILLGFLGAALRRHGGVLAPELGERLRRHGDELESALRGLGVTIERRRGDRLTLRLRSAAWVRDGLAGLGVAVRELSEERLLVRIPDEPGDCERLGAAFETVLTPEALLLDLDGVIADVTGSYRQAVIDTAAELGLAVDLSDVRRIKQLGNANNDWEVTRLLLEEAGIACELDEIVRRFSAHYEGDETRPGLRQTETLLIEPGLLTTLAAALPTAIVTGRPRRDAERFLMENGIAGTITTVVTMEDAPGKPDPAPIRLALERLGAGRAWMVGDSPDDMSAARAAGALPIGLLGPGDDPRTMGQALIDAGAARLLTRLSELEALIP